MSGETGNKANAWFSVSDWKVCNGAFVHSSICSCVFLLCGGCNRNGQFGEMAPECAEAYFRYGAALFAKAQAEGGVLGPTAQRAVEEEEGDEEEFEGDKEQDKEGKRRMLECRERSW